MPRIIDKKSEDAKMKQQLGSILSFLDSELKEKKLKLKPSMLEGIAVNARAVKGNFLNEKEIAKINFDYGTGYTGISSVEVYNYNADYKELFMSIMAKYENMFYPKSGVDIII
ncbi:MAG: hypothetical protein V1886_02310 [archaeon]